MQSERTKIANISAEQEKVLLFELILDRITARKNKDYKKSDEIRDYAKTLGWTFIDLPNNEMQIIDELKTFRDIIIKENKDDNNRHENPKPEIKSNQLPDSGQQNRKRAREVNNNKPKTKQ